METTSSQQKSRIRWVDAIKGIAIVFVVLGHIQTPLTNFIYPWHMPLFFFLSGFFIKTNISLLDFGKKEFKKLMVPFFLFGVLALIAEIAKRQLMKGYPFATQSINYWQEIRGLFFWMDMHSMHHYGFVLWFLPTLFWGRILLFLLLKYIRVELLIELIAFCLYYLASKFLPNLPFAFDKSLIALIWITAGYWYYQNSSKFSNSVTYAIFLIASFLILLLPMPVLSVAGKYFSEPLSNLIYSLIFSIAFIHLIRILSLYLQLRFFNFLGRYTFAIFILHPYTNNISYLLALKFFNSFWLIGFIISIILVLLLILTFEYVGKTKYANLTHRLRSA